MTDVIDHALRQSRELSPDSRSLPLLFAAEEAIARMCDEDVVELQDRLGKNPADGFLYLWLGLAARERGQWTAALDAFRHAIRFGVSHWRVGWYIAQAAKASGQIALVDQACASVLKVAPQFWFARELPKHARGYYSQAGQDKVVEQFFAKCPPRHKVFVEVGAFDGVHYSNVRRLHEKHGWSGVTFEPVTKNFRKASASYAGRSVKCVQAAVSTVDTEMEINVSTYPHLPDWGSDVATFGEADTERWAREFGATWTKEKVPVRRLSRLLDEAGIEAFDFISIDTEGHDLEVLRSLDFKRYQPLLIVIEYGENKAAIAEILEGAGYGILQDNRMDFIACPKVLPDRAASRGQPQVQAGVGKVERFVEQFFAHQSPRSRTLLELGARSEAFRHFTDVLGWCCVGERTALPDLLVVSEANDALGALRSFDFVRCAPQAVAVSYGSQRAAIVELLAKQGYSPFGDEEGMLAAARFDSLSSGASGVPSTRNFTGLTGKAGYNEIEDEFQANLHGWLRRSAESLERIVIVGACFGLEVKTFLERYPRAEIHVFEPSQRHFPRLQAMYAHEPRVHCHRFAVSDRCGTATFHEGSLQGTGSLMPLCDKNDPDAWVPFEAREEFEVQLTTLDAFEPLRGAAIDLLWCDVQGAERQVLRGGAQTLARCQAIFLEVATNRITYQGQCRFHELDRCAHDAGFYLAGIGLCPSGNGTGNAAWLRVPGSAAAVSATPYSAPEAFRPVTGDELQSVLSRLNPHLLASNYLPLEREVRTGSVDPLELVTPDRFDLAIKYLYARHRELGVQTDWARELYHAHIRAFSGGSCREGDGSKNSIDDYFRAFDRLLDDVRAHGFDAARSLVPVAKGNVLVDGAHRAAACLLHRRPVDVLAFDRTDMRFGFEYFRQQGLDEASSDAAALEYCRLRPDTYVAVVFPSAEGREDEIRGLINREGRLVYAKQVTLNRQGARNLVCELYTGEPWLGDWRNNFAGANGKMEPCFRKDGPVRVYVFQAQDLETVRRIKVAIRDLFGIANHSVHINDTHGQAIQLAQVFLNANSIHFLNHAKPRHLERFVRHLERYRMWLSHDGRDPENFCIDGSAVMAAYGLRDAQDLDVLHFGPADFKPVMPEVNSHNADAHHHATTRDDIIFNPANHFYAFGLKFASLDIIRQLKARRNEGKDQKDVALIDACCDATALSSATAAPGRPPKIVALIPARNEAARLPFCLRALKPHVDAIVYLDDCSDDDSVKVVESMATECHVEHIIRKTIWHRDEPGDRNALLAAGRRLGGTHFIVLDADEAFTANCARDGYLRRLILTLRPGETLALSWIQLWRSVRQYRFDRSQWTYASKAFAFCDDGRATYRSGFIHTQRIPNGLGGRTISAVNYVHGVMHFQFVDWPNLQIKQAWYRCMERVRQPGRSAREINAQYAPSEDESGLGVCEVPADWFEGYGDLDATGHSIRDERRIREVLGWFREHGVGRFAELDIWRVDWASYCEDAALAGEIRAASRRGPASAKSFPVPAEAHRHMTLARECLARGDLAGCRRGVEDAHAVAPEHPEILSALGNMQFMAKEFLAARQTFEASLKIHPEQPGVWAQLAATEQQLKNLGGFAAALQRALELDGDCVAALRLMADFQSRRGQHAPAAGAYRKLVQLDPKNVGAWCGLGQSLRACGEFEEAGEALRKALEIDPKSEVARRVLAGMPRKARTPEPRASREAAVSAR